MAASDEDDFATLFAASEAARTRERRVAAGDVVRGRVIAVGATTAFIAVSADQLLAVSTSSHQDAALACCEVA